MYTSDVTYEDIISMINSGKYPIVKLINGDYITYCYLVEKNSDNSVVIFYGDENEYYCSASNGWTNYYPGGEA